MELTEQQRMDLVNAGWTHNIELGERAAMTAVQKLRQQVEIRGTRSPFGAIASAALAEIEAALPAMREYARKNPKHHFSTDGTEQDPNGAHAWLDRNDKPA